MKHIKKYEEYLIESVAYSSEDDVAEEKTEFDMKKVYRAEKILPSLVPYELSFDIKINLSKCIETEYIFSAREKTDEKFIIVSQEYFNRLDRTDRPWRFPEDSDGNYCEIFRIRYIQSSAGREILEFNIYQHKKVEAEYGYDSSIYYTVYDITRQQFSQFELQGFKLAVIELRTQKMYNYNDPELEMTILEIIDMF